LEALSKGALCLTVKAISSNEMEVTE
jgi:hypothetical protein